MADAFGLAVNILTVLEIGRKFAVLAWDIYNDDKNGIPGIASLEVTSKDLNENARHLRQLGSSLSTHPDDQTEEQIRRLAEKCVQVAAQMQETLGGLSMDKMGRNKRSAVARAIKYKWKENDIKEFQNEIEELRDELMLNLIISLRNGMKKSLHNQDAVVYEFAESRSRDQGLKERLEHMARQQEGFGQLMVEILSSTASSTVGSGVYSTPQVSLRRELVNTAQKVPSTMQSKDLAKLAMSRTRLARVREQFIGVFRYDSMFDREAGVAEAHPDTLGWIFKNPRSETIKWDNFSQWLESEDQLYWITGKMGSGKSTLMKYISEELPAISAAEDSTPLEYFYGEVPDMDYISDALPTILAAGQPTPIRYVSGELPPSTPAARENKRRRCTPYLLRWAQYQPLFIATFYFWAGSSEDSRIQTSVEGLYRTLLTQLLTQILELYPDAGPFVSPRRWENICLFNENLRPPGITELRNILSKAIEYVSSRAKICLFIDGLDEFEGENEDLKGLITWIKTLVKTTTVKLCVASRPWRVFEDALQGRPHLLMEEFNSKDIQQYVWNMFHDDPNFREKKRIAADFCNQILDEIINKAEGIFLWVHIVCTHLLEAMSRGDLMGDLRKIIDELPVDMERLYGHILANLEPRDKDRAAKYFLLMQACWGWPDALVFSFADDIGEDSEFALKLSQEPLPYAELLYRVSELRKRLNSRCRGILSLSTKQVDIGEERGIVQYCHRSAKDYLAMDKVQGRLNDMLHAPFEPHLRLCSAHLARWKCSGDDLSKKKRTPQSILFNCVKHAAKVPSGGHEMMIRVLDDLNVDFQIRSYRDDLHFGQFPWFGGNILSLAVVLGVKEYVKTKVRRGQGCMVKSSSVQLAREPADEVQWHTSAITRLIRFLREHPGENVRWPLLLDALLAPTEPNPEMVSLLLENGADPNLIIGPRSQKIRALDVVIPFLWSADSPLSKTTDVKEAWRDSICLLLQYGAKPQREDVEYLREFLGEDVVRKLKLPHLGRHRVVISKHYTRFRWSPGHKVREILRF